MAASDYVAKRCWGISQMKSRSRRTALDSVVSKALMRLAATAHMEGVSVLLCTLSGITLRASPDGARGPHSAFPQSSDGQALSVAIAGEWLNHSWSSVSAISEEDRFGSLADAPPDPEDKALVSTDDAPFDD